MLANRMMSLPPVLPPVLPSHPVLFIVVIVVLFRGVLLVLVIIVLVLFRGVLLVNLRGRRCA